MLYNQSISQRKEASVAAAVLACVESSACIPAQSFSLVLEASGSNSGARQDVPFEGLDATDIESEADLHKALELYACGSRASGVQASQHAQQVYATQELFCSLPDAEPASQTVSASQRRRQVPTLAFRAPHDLGACAYTATEAAALHWLQGCSTSQSLGPALRSPGPQNSLSGQSFALAAGALVGGSRHTGWRKAGFFSPAPALCCEDLKSRGGFAVRPSSDELSARQARTQARELDTEKRIRFLCLAGGT